MHQNQHNFVNFKILSPLERELNLQQNPYNTPTTPLSCCHAALRKSEVSLLRNLEENANENVMRIDFKTHTLF